MLRTTCLVPGWVCLILLLPFWAGAQSPDSIGNFNLDETVITGTREATLNSRVPASISVVDARELRQSGAINVFSLLPDAVPGMFINDRAIAGYGVGPTSAGGISIRGLSGTPNTQVLVLVDGQPQYMGLFGHPITDSYMSSDIERIEVLRGSGSVLYGSHAFGGAVNLITRSARPGQWSLGGRAAYGSFNTQHYQLKGGIGKDSLRVWASVNHLQTDGHREDGQDDFRSTVGFIKMGYRFSPQWSLNADVNLSDASFYDPGPLMDIRTDNYYDYQRGRAALSLDNDLGRVGGSLKLFYNFGEHRFFDQWHSNDDHKGITFYQNIQTLPGQMLTVGMDYNDYGGTGRNESLAPPANRGLGQDIQFREVSGYALLRQDLGPKWGLSGGLRYTHHNEFGGRLIPNAGITYALSPVTHFKGNLGRAYRNPTPVDLFIFPPANEDLVPEEMWNYELGWFQGYGQGAFRTGLTLFYMEGDNLIQVVPRNVPGPPQRQNVGKFDQWGLEFTWQHQVSPAFRWGGNYTHLHFDDIRRFAPAHSLNMQATLSKPNWLLRASAKYISGLYTDFFGLQEAHYWVVNARGEYALNSWLRLQLEVKNLLDAAYQIDAGYPMPPTTLMAGMAFQLDRPIR